MIRLAAALLLAASILAAGCVPLVVGGAAVGGAAVSTDRRTPETQLHDQRIELQAGQRIGTLIKDDGHVNITSYNKQVLLTGETRTEALKQEVERTAAAISDVKTIHNEIQVAPLASLAARSNDSYLTGVVKARFVNDQKFNPLHVKVVTEASIVYLLGIVTRKEADDATNIARHVSGVKRVVRVFDYVTYEYVNPQPAAQPAAGEPAK
jgi:osmotically-inducible protein OsmY